MSAANGHQETAPETVRRLDTPSAATLAGLAAGFEDLQTVLRCCEQLVTMLTPGPEEPDDIVIEAVWTTALLSYARCFADRPAGPLLTDDDVVEAQPDGDVLSWHRVLLELRDHYADAAANPRERFSVGVAQARDGTAGGVAITSARQPLVDDLTVRQTGAIAFALSRVLDRRIVGQQRRVVDELRDTPGSELGRLPELVIARTAPA
jgi:hypothetical protein